MPSFFFCRTTGFPDRGMKNDSSSRRQSRRIIFIIFSRLLFLFSLTLIELCRPISPKTLDVESFRNSPCRQAYDLLEHSSFPILLLSVFSPDFQFFFNLTVHISRNSIILISLSSQLFLTTLSGNYLKFHFVSNSFQLRSAFRPRKTKK